MQDIATTKGYKGYTLQDRDKGSRYVVSPTGVRLVIFTTVYGKSLPLITPLIEGLDCCKVHQTEEHAIKYIVKKYELLTTSRIERFRWSASKFLTHSAWVTIASIAAIIAAVASVLTYFKL